MYLWVDGNDPAWQSKRNATIGKTDSAAENCDGRYVDNDELRYSLRSLEAYAPWIRKIFIVTDGQVPVWLDTSNPKISIIDHKDILPRRALPTFNSVTIEHAIHRIPGLSEHFLYANDDMFFNRPVLPSDFFTMESFPIMRMNRRPFRRLSLWLEVKVQGKTLSNYNRTILNSARLVEKKYGKFIGHKTHHNIDAYRRSDFEHAYNTFRAEIEPTLVNHVRSDNDIQRNLYTYVAMAEGKCKVKFVGNSTSFRLHIHRHAHYSRLAKANPMLFCMNDSQYATDEDRKTARAFLKRRFPEKSVFEKSVV